MNLTAHWSYITFLLFHFNKTKFNYFYKLLNIILIYFFIVRFRMEENYE